MLAAASVVRLAMACHPDASAPEEGRAARCFVEGLSIHSGKTKRREEGFSPPSLLSGYRTLGDLRQDPGHTASSSAEAKNLRKLEAR